MFYQPTAPFRRAIAAAPLQQQMQRALPVLPVDKWDALRELTIARKAFGLNDRDLAVLQALLSFHPGNKLDDPAKLVVFPSNATLSERLNGMPCSTMRRHLARLVDAEMIARRDSPNGKRYRRREGQAFGFDLTPLARRYGEIQIAANDHRREQRHIDILREKICLLRRDLASQSDLADVAELIELTGKALRRKMTVGQLEALSALLAQAVDNLCMNTIYAEDPSGSDSQNEQHQYSNKTYIPESDSDQKDCEEDLQLSDVVNTCTALTELASEPIQDWVSLVREADKIRPMMGICSSAWQQAVECMGRVTSSVVLAAILQRFTQIRSPGAYLRSLSAKAATREFSAIQMIRALPQQKFTAVN